MLSAIIMEEKHYNKWAYLSMIPLCGGTTLSSFTEVNFSWLGIFFSVSAVVLRAVKNLLQGQLLQDRNIDSVLLTYYATPFNFVIFGIGCLLLEGWAPFERFWNSFGDGLFLAIIFSCVVACTFNIAANLLVKSLSAVGAAVCTNAKTPLTIIFSVCLFRNRVGIAQIIGCVLTFWGAWLFAAKGSVIKPNDKQGSAPVERPDFLLLAASPEDPSP